MATDLSQYEKRGYLMENFRLFHLRDTGMERVDWHYHDFHKIIVFLSGSADYAIEGKRYTLLPGDIVLVGRGCIHRPEPAQGKPYERIILYISPAFLRECSTLECDLETCFLLAERQFRFVLRPSGRYDHRVAVLTHLEQALNADGFGEEILRRSLFMQFMVEVNRACTGSGLQYVDTAVCDEKIVSILQYINQHMTEDISIDALAARFYVSKYHMMRKFKKETGYTIHSYLSEKRLMLAKELISGGMPVLETCEKCGYQDYSAFSRAYRKLFGVTPRQKLLPAQE
jgi:AraC-like DNA-binding protein